MEWKEVRLGDVCNIITGFPFSGKKYSKEGIRVVRGDNVTIGNLRWDTEKDKRWNEPFDKTEYYSLQANDIVIGMDGSRVGKNKARIKEEDLPLLLAQRVACVRHNELAEQDYLYYNIFSKKFIDYVNSIHTGSAIPHISQKQIGDYMILLPDLETQRRIASILSSLDRKIELNNKINADLEEMAQVIFKNWFVDFEPFKDGKFVDSELGMIPEGWKVISLSEIMKYNGGSQPPASEFIDTYQEGYIRFIQIRDYDNDSHITYIPISKRNKLCDELDIMIARYGAALGRICWGLKGAYNVALAKVIPIKSYYREYLRCYLNTSYFYQSINNKGARCAQSGFNQSDINSYMIAFPIDETVVMNFDDLCSSIMDKRLSLKYENSRLSLLRDTLLPRLMSGELEVPE